MWFLAAAALAAPPEPSDSLASQLKRGLLLHSGDFGEVQLVRVVLYPEIIRLSDSKLELLLQQEEWLAVGVIETKSHGRLRVTCHLDRCVAESGGVSIEISLVKGPLSEEDVPKKRRPRKKSEAVAEQQA
jgi:hypothetical protein